MRTNFTDFYELTTPLIADACLRLKIPLRIAKNGISSIISGQKIVGRALPVQHFGSVDIFIEVMHNASAGDILVIDNQGRTDESCIGDLTVLEAKANQIAGIIVWGLHRDTEDLLEIGFPVFSYGTCPTGPQRLDSRTGNAIQIAQFGDFSVTNEDFVFADADGVLFAPLEKAAEILNPAKKIQQTEKKQAKMIGEGETLYRQLRFKEYLTKRQKNTNYSFREHLRKIGGAIEE
ncbi:MAG: RraA family protein [Pyrinomonadaceae bacterium]|nr:RraA family protein [Pyrinomonadaceae bacterium]